MLYDAQSFPSIMPPGMNPAAQASQNMEYPGNVMAHMNKNQQAVYQQRSQQMQQQPQQRPGMEGEAAYGGFPSKRMRRGSHVRDHPSATAIPGPFRSGRKPQGSSEEDEIPVDYMDSLTPRELALTRYIQHHEWLEEVVSSPYDTHRIIPPRLGLGRKGEIESLTKDFFDAPLEIEWGSSLKDAGWITSKEQAMEGKPVVDEVDPKDRLDYQRVGKLDSANAQDFREMATARLDQLNAEMEQMKKDFAEQMARLQQGSDLQKAELLLRKSTMAMLTGNEMSLDESQDLDNGIKALETSRGKNVKSVLAVECLEEGGRQEKAESPALATDPDELHGDERGLCEQNLGATDANHKTDDTIDTTPAEATNPTEAQAQPETAEQEPVDESFVMVDKDDAIPPASNDVAGDEDAMDFTTLQADGEQLGDADLADFDASADVNFDSNDFGEGIDFGDMDTAGDDLSGYAQEIANMGGTKRDDLGPDSPTIQGHLGVGSAPGGPPPPS